jgi:nitrate reductase assembly molybdenum cofactor insertion protein NarJ
MNKEQYFILSELFKYPKEGYQDNVKKCMFMLEDKYPEAAKTFERFYDYIKDKTLYQVEEVFGFTFHIQAICFLDVGYVLFGEDYTRGEFLVNMKAEQAKINHDCEEELADNLPHVLQLMAISDDKDFVEELAVRAVIPALEKMLVEFKASRTELRKKIMKKKQKAIIMEDIKEGNIYQNAIQALLIVLQTDFAGIDFGDEKIEQSLSNFIPDCGTC